MQFKMQASEILIFKSLIIIKLFFLLFLSAKNRDKYGKEMAVRSNGILCNKQQECMRWEKGDGTECQERVLV